MKACMTVTEMALRPEGGGIQSASRMDAPSCADLRAVPSLTGGHTELRLSVLKASELHVGVYDRAGRELARMHQGEVAPGFHSWTWDGRDAEGREVPSGVYFCRATADGTTAAARLVLIR